MLGLGLSIEPRRASGAGGPVTGVTAIGAEGWRGTYASPPEAFDPEGAPEFLSVQRNGFDASGSAVTVNDPLTIMARVRQPYPDQASLTPDEVALSHFVYADDTIVGVSNQSARAYPKPVAMWLNHDRDRATGQSFTARLAVAHAHARAGRPVAAVRFTASDGTTTVETVVSTMSVVSYAASGLSVPHFAGTLDLSALADDALVTVDAVIHPWVGDAFTVSADADAYPSPNLTVLKVLNDVAYGTAYAYVDVAGDDGTAVVSETPATAQASPYATIAAAASAIQAYNAANLGRDDASGGVIRLEEGTHTHSSYSSVAVGDIPLLIEAVGSRAATIYQDAGTSTSNSIPDLLKIRGVTLKRNASSDVIFLDNGAGDAAHLLVLEACTFDDGGHGGYAAWFYRLGRVVLIGCDGDRIKHTASFGTAAKMVVALGSAGECVGATTYAAAGCLDLNTTGYTDSSKTDDRVALVGGFLGFSHLGTASTSSGIVGMGLPIGPRGLALVGNVIEHHGSTTPAAVSILADNNTDPAENLIAICNTVVGSRSNLLYQDSGTVAVAKSGVFRFNVDRARNVKTDVFAGDGALVGNWPHAFHVGDRANATLLGSSSGSGYGAGAWLGEVAALGNADGSGAAPLDPDWADDRSNDGTGAGGGDYTPGAASALPPIPAGLAPHAVDQKGRAVADDGTGVAGALMPL
ncbi:MAG TPA: hypothetical protein VMM55_08945 [Thermohalobaculum sp.]|nr:hypothetical protein [Thermohalobaculum sp.]